MADRKQVMDIHPNRSGISKQESNEQQRKWTDKLWENKTHDSLANYDRTRSHLNFEVTKGGKVQPIDTSETISEKMDRILKERNIKNPNARKNVKREQRILAQMIFGGSRERMMEIAFGDNRPNLEKGADNSHITRTEDIEKWAVDIYNFVARKFGEENIVSFYVHLDETNPHCHCTVLPIDEERNRISWVARFGKNPMEEKATLIRLHNELNEEVNKYWGLERGSSREKTGAKHRSTEEYKRDLINEVVKLETTKEGLQRQIRKAEIKLKSLSTMIANLQARKETVNAEIELIARQFGQDGQNQEMLAKRMAELRHEMEDIDHKIAERQRMLADTNTTLSNARSRLEELKREHTRMQEYIGDDADQQAAKLQKDVLTTYNKMVSSSLQPLMPTLTTEQREVLERSGFNALTEDSHHVINCALLLALEYVKEATTYAESHGGGGGSSLSGWGRNKDDDDERWWMKCIAQSASMMRSGGRKVRHKR